MEIKTHFKDHKEVIINELNNAKHSIKIAVAWFTNIDLYQVIYNQIKSNLKVDLIIINDEINNRIGGLDWQKFIDMGGNLYFGDNDCPMHHKFCIIDDSVLINGSFNWTYLASTINCENITVFKGINGITDAFVEEFDKIRKELPLQKDITPFAQVPIRFTSIFSARNYLSSDLQQRASIERKKGNLTNARNLLGVSTSINPNNQKAESEKVEIRDVVYRLWKKDYLLDKIELLENRTILHFRTIVHESAWMHGPNAKFAWLLRDSKNTDRIIKLIAVKNIRLNNLLVAEELEGNSIIQFNDESTPSKFNENYDWIEHRGYKPNLIEGRFVDHNNKMVHVIQSHAINGDVLECEIYFPAVPKDYKIVDLIEGYGREEWENHWNCFDIEIEKNQIKQ